MTEDILKNELLKGRSTPQMPDTLKAPEAEGNQFMALFNSPATNELTRTHTQGRGKSLQVDAITGRATVKKGRTDIFISEYEKLRSGLRPSTHKLLDASTIQLAMQNEYKGSGEMKRTVVMDLEDYMRLCGRTITKPNKDKMRREINQDLDTLYQVSLRWEENAGKGRTEDYEETRIIERKGFKRGKVLLTFTESISEYLRQSYIFNIPTTLFKLDSKNPTAYYIGRKLSIHFGIDANRARDTHNIISVKKLLEHAEDTIPSYEDVIGTKGQQLEQRIMQPLEKALDTLEMEGIIQWEWCNSKKTQLTDEQLFEMDYYTFIDLYIHFEVMNYPDQTLRIESKEAKKKKSSKKNKK